MALQAPAGEWVSLLLLAGLVVLAAKAHGRQVRLERELRGFDEVDFMADNDPWVEALWKRDRRLFWPAFAAALAGALLLSWFLGPAPLPFVGGPAWPRWVDLLAGVGWALVGAFAVAGMASLLRFLRAPAGAARKDPAWGARARRGSAFWWGLAAVASAAWVVAAS